MAEKTISLNELQRLKSEGAEVEFETEVMQIDRFDELLATLKSMADNEAERIRADIARNQTNLEILATLQSLVRKAGDGPKSTPVDLSPIFTMLEEMRAERTREPVDYDFNIIRPGGDGFQPATKIEARAVKPVTH